MEIFLNKDILNKPDSLRYMTSPSKNQKQYFLLHFDTNVRFVVLRNEVEDTSLRYFFE